MLVPLASEIEEGGFRGARGFQQLRAMEELSWEADLEGVVDLAGNKVLAVFTTRYSGQASGASAEQRHWLVIKVRDGRIWRSEAYDDVDRALKAALGEVRGYS